MLPHDVRFTAQKVAQRIALIEPLVYRRRQALPPFRYRPLDGPADEPPIGPDHQDADWALVEPNTYWGRWQTEFVLRTHFRRPAGWEEGSPVALYLPLGEAGDFSHPETLAYIDGQPYAACDRHHQEIVLPDSCLDGRPHLLSLHGWTGLGTPLGELGARLVMQLCPHGLPYVVCDRHKQDVPVPIQWRDDVRDLLWLHGWTAAGTVLSGESGTRLFMRPCALVQIHQPARDFLATARVALGAASSLDHRAPARERVLESLDQAFRVLDTREPFGEGFYESVHEAHRVLRQGIEEAGPPLDVQVVGTGHAHIDLAWLWTLGQTRRKAVRTFTNVIRLMERFPDYHFTQSQPQLYELVRLDAPELFEAIRGLVGQGRWEPVGGMWVEADCNLSGPESLARQLLLGRSYFARHFGPQAESPVLWLPDVFGYAWALPQLMRQAGLRYFMTIKIGWSQYNRLPYDSFWWQGVDGSRVLTHFSTTPGFGPSVSTYNARATPEEILGTWTNFQQKGAQRELLAIFGHGNGGGGPTAEMLENLGEMTAFPGLPRVRQGAVGDFFRRLEAEAGDRLPTWDGELYLELHRGTYTTQSRNKRANRKSEFLLHDAELLAAMALVLDPDYRYPAAELRRAWELVCLNQFHDILPGSSIGAVYEESLRQYEEVGRLAREARDGALETIGRQVGGDLLLVNPTSFPRSDLAHWAERLPAGERLERADGSAVRTQASADGGTWIDGGELPPLSVTALFRRKGAAPQVDQALTAEPELLQNERLRVELDRAGEVVRIYDRTAEREVLPGGAVANQLQAFEDRPLSWDAWDVDIYFEDKRWTAEPASSVKVLEAGPLRATLELRRRVLSSEVVQRVSLERGSARLDFDTEVEWRERHVLLKVAFPVEVLSPTATYEIQWGSVERPTHGNTSWDWARFETCAQKWADLSEGDYGVSLLNDCKYGHDVRGSVLRLSLLRSPTMPDPQADQGKHRFTYSLLPHQGRWGEETVGAAYALNDPLLAVPGPGEGGSGDHTFLQVSSPNVVIETVKGAEDGRGIIVRLYESQRRRGPVTLTAGFDLSEAWESNLLEEDQAPLKVEDRSIRLSLRPYEIVTLRLLASGRG